MNKTHLPSTSDLVRKYNLAADKSLGQNFIFDENFTTKIAKSAGDLSEAIILEIGAGPGGLTRAILNANAKRVVAIEKDSRCLAALRELQEFYSSRLEIIECDALEFNEIKHFEKNYFNESEENAAEMVTKVGDFKQVRFKIIANLPYNIGTVLLIKWLKIADHIDSINIMLQKEVAERIVAKPRTKAYGRLAVMCNFVCETKILFSVNPQVFTPQPKINSAIIELKPRSKRIADVSFLQLEKVVACAFNQRRKMLKSSLKPLFTNPIAVLNNAEIDPSKRPEELSIEEFCRLASLLSSK